jgi:hypothetical protein
VVDLIGALERVVDPAYHGGNAVHRIEALVGIHLPRAVGVRRNLPAAQIDPLEAGRHLLHRLVAGQGAQRAHRRPGGDQVPQALGAQPRQRMLDVDAATQAHHVLRAVAALDSAPAGIVLPGIADLIGAARVRHGEGLPCEFGKVGRRSA